LNDGEESTIKDRLALAEVIIALLRYALMATLDSIVNIQCSPWQFISLGNPNVRGAVHAVWDISPPGGMILPESVPGRKQVDWALSTAIDLGAPHPGRVSLCR